MSGPRTKKVQIHKWVVRAASIQEESELNKGYLCIKLMEIKDRKQSIRKNLVCHRVLSRTNGRHSWQELDIQEGKSNKLKEGLGSNDGK
eukprot:1252514-Ditylum_brightwellii.AAC.1